MVWELYTESGEWICTLIHAGGKLTVDALGNEQKIHFFQSLRGVIEHPDLGYIEADTRDAESYGRMLHLMLPALGVRVEAKDEIAGNKTNRTVR